MTTRDKEYYLRRADVEDALARSAASPEAACAHAELAIRYRDRVARSSPKPLDQP